MNIYIKELDKDDQLFKKNYFPKFIQRIIIKFTEITNKFFIININEENKIYILPNKNKEKTYKNIVKKVKSYKTKKKIELILSKKIKENAIFLKKIKIVDGKYILTENIEKILQKIIGENPIEIIDLYILANNYTKQNVNFAKKISKKVKTVNIITNQIEKYKVLEEMLLEDGIAISISNNRKKCLKNAKIIINLDFNKKDLDKYIVNRNACIININDETIMNNVHGFEGIVIRNVEVAIPNENAIFLKANNIYQEFDKIDLYEAIKGLKEDIKIEALYGYNGKINEKELLNVRKILTNLKN